MSEDKPKKDRSDPAPAGPQSKRSFINHLLNQPEGPETPRASVVPRDMEF